MNLRITLCGFVFLAQACQYDIQVLEPLGPTDDGSVDAAMCPSADGSFAACEDASGFEDAALDADADAEPIPDFDGSSQDGGSNPDASPIFDASSGGG
jgi:hypothetical protein